MKLVVVMLMSASLAALGPAWAEEATAPAEDEASSLSGAPVYARDGTEIGTVAGTRSGENEQLVAIVVEAGEPLGLGTRQIMLGRPDFVALRGAVSVDMSPTEFDRYPAAPSE